MIVNTGYGYIRDLNGNIVAKYELPQGEHPSVAGYTYHEVATRKELDAVEVFIPPETDEQKVERLIAEKQRELAIVELKKEGKLKAVQVVMAPQGFVS